MEWVPLYQRGDYVILCDHKTTRIPMKVVGYDEDEMMVVENPDGGADLTFFESEVEPMPDDRFKDKD